MYLTTAECDIITDSLERFANGAGRDIERVAKLHRRLDWSGVVHVAELRESEKRLAIEAVREQIDAVDDRRIEECGRIIRKLQAVVPAMVEA